VKDKSDIDLVVYMRDDGIDGTIEEQRKKAIDKKYNIKSLYLDTLS
jgi:hypothetical protein